MSNARFHVVRLDAAYDRAAFDCDSEPLNSFREQVTGISMGLSHLHQKWRVQKSVGRSKAACSRDHLPPKGGWVDSGAVHQSFHLLVFFLFLMAKYLGGIAINTWTWSGCKCPFKSGSPYAAPGCETLPTFLAGLGRIPLSAGVLESR